MLALPSLLLAVTLVAHGQRPSQWTVILAVAIVNMPIFARLLRGSMLAQRESDHVLAARALGVRQRAIVLRHMLPNAMSPVIVQATLTLATAILDAAALSFLGLGDPDINRAEWGLMLGGEGQTLLRDRAASWRTTRPSRSSSSRSASPCSASPCARPSTRRTGGEHHERA